MQPLQRGHVPEAEVARILAELRQQKVPQSTIELTLDEIYSSEVWLNDTYQVSKREAQMPGGLMWHLSIRRLDRQPVTDWREKQAIKNQLCGPECEGVELYPAESRLVDTANQFHLWVIQQPGVWFPFGFETRLTDEDLPFQISKAEQRPR